MSHKYLYKISMALENMSENDLKNLYEGFDKHVKKFAYVKEGQVMTMQDSAVGLDSLTNMQGEPFFQTIQPQTVQNPLGPWLRPEDKQTLTPQPKAPQKPQTAPVAAPQEMPEDSGLFPVETIDGEKLTKNKFQNWVRSDIREYIDSVVEDLRSKGDHSSEQIYNYVISKGWRRFINGNNPIKLFLSYDDENKYMEYTREFEKQTGKNMKDIYMGYAKKISK